MGSRNKYPEELILNMQNGQDWDEEFPHLCRFEAMQLGWVDKYPVSS